MANEQTLREYLVSIGFKVNEADYKKFASKLKDTEKKFENLKKSVEQVGKVALATATALSASVTLVADKLDKLYFVSQRTGASAGNLKAFEFAAEQIGVSAGEARSAVEGMARSLRLSPGLAGYLKSLNINPNQDRVKLLMDLVDRLRHLPFYQGAQIARLFGIDDQTLVMLEKNFDELKRYEAERRKIAGQAGLNMDEMTSKSHAFMLALRGLWQRFELLGDVIAARFLPAGEKVVSLLDKMVDLFLKADKSTSGWSSRVLGVAVALGAAIKGLSILKAMGGLFGAGGAGAGAGAAAGGEAAAAGAAVAGGTAGAGTAAAVGAGGGAAAATGLGRGAFGLLSPITAGGVAIAALEAWIFSRLIGDQKIKGKADQLDAEASNRLAKMGRQVIPGLGIYTRVDTPEGIRWVKEGTRATLGLKDHLVPIAQQQLTLLQRIADASGFTRGDTPGIPAGISLHSARQLFNPGNLRKWGRTPVVNLGKIGSFAKFNSAQEGLSAMAGQLLRDYHRGFNTLEREITKWAPPSENNTEAYIADVGKRMGVKRNTPLNLASPTVLKELMAAMIHHEQGKSPYSTRQITEAVNYRLGHVDRKGPVTLHQETHIAVTGTGDPRETGRAVIDNQKRVNGDLIRNLQGVTR